MLDNEKTAMLADDLAALDLAHRREVATEWRRPCMPFRPTFEVPTHTVTWAQKESRQWTVTA